MYEISPAEGKKILEQSLRESIKRWNEDEKPSRQPVVSREVGDLGEHSVGRTVKEEKDVEGWRWGLTGSIRFNNKQITGGLGKSSFNGVMGKWVAESTGGGKVESRTWDDPSFARFYL